MIKPEEGLILIPCYFFFSTSSIPALIVSRPQVVKLTVVVIVVG